VVPADQDAISGGCLADIQDRTERDPGGAFHDGGVLRRPADAQQDGAGLLRHANRGEPLGPEQREDRDLRERRRVGEQGGEVVHALLRGERLAARRDRLLAVDAADKRT
jgi:hypothetical protein